MKAIPSAGTREVALPDGEVAIVHLCGTCEEAPIWAKGRCLKCYAKVYAQENPEKVRLYSARRYKRFKEVKAAVEADLKALSDDATAVEDYLVDYPDEREAVEMFFSDNWEATLADYLRLSRGCDTCGHLKNMGPNMVPYGSTMVNAGDEWDCELGHAEEECDIVRDYVKGGD